SMTGFSAGAFAFFPVPSSTSNQSYSSTGNARSASLIHQRQFRSRLSLERRRWLDELDFVWSPFEAMWDDQFADLSRNRQWHSAGGRLGLPLANDGHRRSLGAFDRHAKGTGVLLDSRQHIGGRLPDLSARIDG